MVARETFIPLEVGHEPGMQRKEIVEILGKNIPVEQK